MFIKRRKWKCKYVYQDRYRKCGSIFVKSRMWYLIIALIGINQFHFLYHLNVVGISCYKANERLYDSRQRLWEILNSLMYIYKQTPCFILMWIVNSNVNIECLLFFLLLVWDCASSEQKKKEAVIASFLNEKKICLNVFHQKTLLFETFQFSKRAIIKSN